MVSDWGSHMAGKAGRRTAPFCVLVLLLMLVSPAQAAPATPTITVQPNTITPYISAGCIAPRLGCYRAKGTADPGARIILTVSDMTGSGASLVASTFAATQSDPGNGVQAGDWELSPNVTDLGLHGTTPSTLVFTAVAEVGTGNQSAPATATATKEAATTGDIYAPLFQNTASNATGNWCRTYTCNSNCGTLDTVPNGCRTYGDIFPCGSTYNCNQSPRYIKGRVNDNVSGNFGLASEIADITVTVTRASDEVVVQELRSIVRRGSTADYHVNLFRDHYDIGLYRWAVQATDAWGRPAGNEHKGEFRITA